MLKAELIRPRLQVREGQVWTKALPLNYHYLQIATELNAVFERLVGQSRGALSEALREYEGDSLEYPIIRGLASVLEGRCTFGNEPPVKPTELRTHLFEQGPITSKRDLFSLTTREQAIAETAVHYELTPQQVETALFADLAEEQILLDPGDPLPPADLITRYNLELARGLLYWAREVRITIGDRYKDIFKYIKLFKLMYTVRSLSQNQTSQVSKSRAGTQPLAVEDRAVNIQQGPDLRGHNKPAGYHITLHGPISPFVHSTIRYGLQFAKFMPALLLAENWQMEADVQPPGLRSHEPLRYSLNDQTTLRTHFKASTMFDSRLEADFAAEFLTKYSGVKRKWELAREDEVIVTGDTVMIPDFSLTHRKDGRRALVEIVGFWHPQYLQRKLQKVRQAGRSDMILLVYESVNVAEDVFTEAAAGEVLTFARKPVLKDVLAAVERCAVLVE